MITDYAVERMQRMVVLEGKRKVMFEVTINPHCPLEMKTAFKDKIKIIDLEIRKIEHELGDELVAIKGDYIDELVDARAEHFGLSLKKKGE